MCVKAARRWCEKTQSHLTHHQFEDLVSFLIVSVWRSSQRFDPERSPSFRAVALGILSNRCVDWMRQHRGRSRWRWSGGKTYERERP